MISVEKWNILTPLQKLPKYVCNLGKIIVAQSIINRPIWSHSLLLLLCQLIHSNPQPFCARKLIYLNLAVQMQARSAFAFEQCDTDLAKFCHFGKSLQVIGKFLMLYFLFDKMLSLLWQICHIFGLIFTVANDQILNNNVTIWSRCF